MKTIAEIANECGVHRTTLNKAIERGAFPARKSGDTWLIDDESEAFKSWQSGNGQGRPRSGHPRTIEAEMPEPPAWVNTPSGKHAWKVNLAWRANAASAEGVGAEQERKHLLREADLLYSPR
jgi:excisionase family DNA binding protein